MDRGEKRMALGLFLSMARERKVSILDGVSWCVCVGGYACVCSVCVCRVCVHAGSVVYAHVCARGIVC